MTTVRVLCTFILLITIPLFSETLQKLDSKSPDTITSPNDKEQSSSSSTLTNAGISWKKDDKTYSLVFSVSAALHNKKCLHLSQTSSVTGARSSFYALSPGHLPSLFAAIRSDSLSSLRSGLRAKCIKQFATLLHNDFPFTDGNIAKEIVHFYSHIEKQFPTIHSPHRSLLKSNNSFRTIDFRHHILT